MSQKLSGSIQYMMPHRHYLSFGKMFILIIVFFVVVSKRLQL